MIDNLREEQESIIENKRIELMMLIEAKLEKYKAEAAVDIDL